MSDIAPRGMVYIADETTNWLDKDLIRRCGGRILGVYMFDERRQVHCCELAPSFELHFLESILSVSSENWREREELEEQLRAADRESPPVQYIHTHQLQSLIDNALSGCWDGDTVPCCVAVWSIEPESWTKLVADQEGNEEAAHTVFMDGLEETIQQSGVY